MEHTAVQEQLDRVEAKLDYLVGRIQELDALVERLAPVIAANPMVKQLLKF